MAAHPFGPLQASLVVGYYKRVRHFDPSLAKPVFVPLCERFLPNAKSDSLFALFNLKFDSKALANGNNFNKSVKVAVNFESGGQVNLLSRGLGYRITFTMAAPLPTEPSTEFGLHVHVDILDFLGKETITTLEWDPDPDVLQAVLDNFQEDNVKELGKFNSLVIEVTGDKLKIVQNLKSEIIIDTVCPTRSQPTSAKSSALKGLNLLLGEIHAKGIQVNETTIPQIVQKVLGILNFMVMNPQNVTKDTKSTFKDYLIHGTSVITQLVSALKTSDDEARGNFAKLDPHFDHLERDVRGWLEADEQLFPAYLTLPYLRKLESVFDYFEDGDVLAKSFLIKNASKLIQKTDIAFFKTVPHFGLFEFQSLLASIIVESTWYQQLQQTYNPDSGYLTKHFVIKDSRPQVKVIPRGPNSTETFFISRCPKMAKVSGIDDFCVVPEKDWLLFPRHSSGGSALDYFCVDLTNLPDSTETVTLESGGMAIPAFDYLLHAQNYPKLKHHASKFGLSLLLSKQNLRHPQMELLTLKFISFRGKPHENKWASVPIFGTLKKQIDSFEDQLAAVRISNSANEIFTAVWALEECENLHGDIESVGKLKTYLFLGCYRVIPGTNNNNPSLSVVKEQLISTHILQPEMDMKVSHQSFWTQHKRGAMFFCAFHSKGCELLVSCYDKQQFVGIGKRQSSALSLFDFRKQFVSLQPTNIVDSVVGVIGVRETISADENHDQYKICSLALKF